MHRQHRPRLPPLLQRPEPKDQARKTQQLLQAHLNQTFSLVSRLKQVQVPVLLKVQAQKVLLKLSLPITLKEQNLKLTLNSQYRMLNPQVPKVLSVVLPLLKKHVHNLVSLNQCKTI
jgi:hypothetical protein